MTASRRFLATRSDVLKTEIGDYLKHAGAEADEVEAPSPVKAPAQAGIQPKLRDPLAAEKARALIDALGGKANIQRVDACAETRLRVLTTNGHLDEAALKAARSSSRRETPQIVSCICSLVSTPTNTLPRCAVSWRAETRMSEACRNQAWIFVNGERQKRPLS